MEVAFSVFFFFLMNSLFVPQSKVCLTEDIEDKTEPYLWIRISYLLSWASKQPPSHHTQHPSNQQPDLNFLLKM